MEEGLGLVVVPEVVLEEIGVVQGADLARLASLAERVDQEEILATDRDFLIDREPVLETGEVPEVVMVEIGAEVAVDSVARLASQAERAEDQVAVAGLLLTDDVQVEIVDLPAAAAAGLTGNFLSVLRQYMVLT